MRRLTELGFWRNAKGNGVCVGLILYEIEYSIFFPSFVLISKRTRGERRLIYIYIYEHTHRRLGGELLTLYGYKYGVSIDFVPRYY